MRRCVSAILLLMVFAGLTLAEQDQRTIEVDPGDTPVVIKGRLVAGAVFAADLRLIARGGAIDKFVFLASDLKDKAGNGLVSRHNVALVGDHKLESDVPKDFRVTVSDVKVPGDYEGHINLLVGKQSLRDAIKVPVELKVTTLPKLELLEGKDKVVFSLVQRGNFADEWLADWLLPASSRINSARIYLSNPTDALVSLKRARYVLAGSTPGSQLAADDQKISAGGIGGSGGGTSAMRLSFRAKDIGMLPLEFDRAAMAPGKYSGSVYLTLDGREDQLRVPMDLSVRSAPLWPCLLLLAGIVLGKLINFMQGLGKKLAEAIEPFYHLRQVIERANPDDREILLPMFKTARSLVYAGKLEIAKAQREAIERRLEVLEQLRIFEEGLREVSEQDAREFRTDIAEIRSKIRLGNDEKAKELFDALIKKDRPANSRARLMGRRDTEETFVQRQQNRMEGVQASYESVLKTVKELRLRTVWDGIKQRFQSVCEWWQEARVELSFWMRPVLKAVLVVGLWLVGVKILYIEKGAVFGANAFVDYLGLVLWGMASDIASRNISDLGKIT